MARADPVLAIDIGGTKMAVGLVEPGGRLASWTQAETPRGLDAGQLWRTLDVLCDRLLAESRVDPGPASPAWAAGAAGRWSGRPGGSRR